LALPNNSKRTKAARKKILHAIFIGASKRMAAGYAGISEDTLERWVIADAGFAGALKKAAGARAVKWLDRIEKAGKAGQWTADAWKLERTESAVFGRQRIEVTGAGGGPIETHVEGASPIVLDGEFARAAGVEPGTRIDHTALGAIASAFFSAANGHRPVHADDETGTPPTN
jgi:hypothetical protein